MEVAIRRRKLLLITRVLAIVTSSLFLFACSSTEHQRVTQLIPELASNATIWRDRVVIHSVVLDYGVIEGNPYVQYTNGSELVCHVRSISKDQHVNDFYLSPYESTPRRWISFDTQVISVSVLCENLSSE